MSYIEWSADVAVGCRGKHVPSDDTLTQILPWPTSPLKNLWKALSVTFTCIDQMWQDPETSQVCCFSFKTNWLQAAAQQYTENNQVSLYSLPFWQGMGRSLCLLWLYILYYSVKQRAKPSSNDSFLRTQASVFRGTAQLSLCQLQQQFWQHNSMRSDSTKAVQSAVGWSCNKDPHQSSLDGLSWILHGKPSRRHNERERCAWTEKGKEIQ